MADHETGTGSLTEKAHWDSKYEPSAISAASQRTPSRLKRLIKWMLGARVLELMRDYRDYLLWDVVYAEHMPRAGQNRVLEVGSAPGIHLVELRDAYALEPYGVEYSTPGVALNRRIFAERGIDPNNVIHADFLSPTFQERYAGFFQVVVSRGVIEHFANVKDAVEKHVNLLAPGGILFVSIPNLRGLNYALTWFFHKELIPLHNIDVMENSRFCALFADRRLTPRFCGNLGAFNFGIFNTEAEKGPRAAILRFCSKLQLLFNLISRLLFGRRAGGGKYSSPYLMFVGARNRGS